MISMKIDSECHVRSRELLCVASRFIASMVATAAKSGLAVLPTDITVAPNPPAARINGCAEGRGNSVLAS